MKVRAIKPGFHGKLREIDEEFDVENGSKASWYVPADKQVTAEAKAKHKTSAGKTKEENSDDLV